MGPTWVLSAPDGPHVGPMNLVTRVVDVSTIKRHQTTTKRNRVRTVCIIHRVYSVVWVYSRVLYHQSCTTVKHGSLDMFRVCSVFSMHEVLYHTPNSRVHRANIGPTWGRQDPGGPHDGPTNFAFWDVQYKNIHSPHNSLIWIFVYKCTVHITAYHKQDFCMVPTTIHWKSIELQTIYFVCSTGVGLGLLVELYNTWLQVKPERGSLNLV